MIVRLIMCFITAVALCMRFELPEELNSLAGGSRMLNIFYNFQLSLTGTMAAATAVFAALVILEKYLHSKKRGETGFYMSSAFFWRLSGQWEKVSGEWIRWRCSMPEPDRR